MAGILDRMLRAARLDARLYEEVEADRSALGQAMLVVVLASIAAGVGSGSPAGVAGIVAGTILALVVWFVWAGLTWFIGARLLPEPQTRADLGELLRTTGFSCAPALTRVFGLIPGAVAPVFLISGLWRLAAMVVAVRQALDYKSTWRAGVVCLIGWLVEVLSLLLFFWIIISASGPA